MKKNFSVMIVSFLVCAVVFAFIGCSKLPETGEEVTEEVKESAETGEEVTEEVKESAEVVEDEYLFAFVPGVVASFYNSIILGMQTVGDSLGFEVVTQIPQDWDAAVQTQIIDSLIARGDIDALIVAPVDSEAMIEVLKRAQDNGITVITTDTFIGDGDYYNGPVKFPVTYIGSDNVEGGRIGGEALAEAIGYEGKVYCQNFKAGASTGDQRVAGFKQAIENYPDIELIGVDNNDYDTAKATTQTTAILQANSDIKGIFGSNIPSAQGAGLAVSNLGLSDEVTVIAFDLDDVAVENMEKELVDMAIAQKPYDMGIWSGMIAYSYLKGVKDIPKRVATGYYIATKENLDDPETLKWIYKEEL